MEPNRAVEVERRLTPSEVRARQTFQAEMGPVQAHHHSKAALVVQVLAEMGPMV